MAACRVLRLSLFFLLSLSLYYEMVKLPLQRERRGGGTDGREWQEASLGVCGGLRGGVMRLTKQVKAFLIPLIFSLFSPLLIDSFSFLYTFFSTYVGSAVMILDRLYNYNNAEAFS